jgi:hypothetical protein
MILQGYLNLKLVLGISSGGDTPATPEQLGKDLSAMMHSCSWSSRCLSKALSGFTNERAEHGFQPNWFLPVTLGGYGVDPAFAPDELKLTREQRLVAKRFMLNPKLQLFQTVGDATVVECAFKRQIKVSTSMRVLDHEAEAAARRARQRHRKDARDFTPVADPRLRSESSDDNADVVQGSWDALPEWIPEGTLPDPIVVTPEMVEERRSDARFFNKEFRSWIDDPIASQQMQMERAATFRNAIHSTPMRDPVWILRSSKLMRRFGRVVPVSPATDAEIVEWWTPEFLTRETFKIRPLSTLRDPLAGGRVADGPPEAESSTEELPVTLGDGGSYEPATPSSEW